MLNYLFISLEDIFNEFIINLRSLNKTTQILDFQLISFLGTDKIHPCIKLILNH